MILHPDRIRHFPGPPPSGGQERHICYWMQQAQRVGNNHALCFALEKANQLKLPLMVAFVLTPDFPDANLRHYRFMLDGIADVQKTLGQKGIPFVLEIGPMVKAVLSLARQAVWVVTDAGYLRIQRQWRDAVAKESACAFTIVESDVIVPVAAASGKEESAARTLRPKIMKKIDAYLDPVALPEYWMKNSVHSFSSAPPVLPDTLAARVAGDHSVSPAAGFSGGETEAMARLEQFVADGLADYDALARDPAVQCRSDLSAHLHFGQISPVTVVRAVRESNAPEKAKEAFIEQLVVRRELAVNFVFYNKGYDRYDQAVPGWAKQTLDDHRGDERSYLYSAETLEAAETHDPYWNAAQMEMMLTGRMHNYMRMYWGKKIIEWSPDPEAAFEIMLALNNRYELDGRDPNGFTGVAWCFGRHDRPFTERPVFGKIRYMNAAGLKRKFKIERYVERIRSLGKDD
jgi:deoxyribodipyrimidine photo-lyase